MPVTRGAQRTRGGSKLPKRNSPTPHPNFDTFATTDQFSQQSYTPWRVGRIGKCTNPVKLFAGRLIAGRLLPRLLNTPFSAEKPKPKAIFKVCYNEDQMRRAPMMAKLRLVSMLRISLATLGAVVVMAVSLGQSKAAPVPAGDAALFERLDVDANGKVSADEVTQEHKQLFARLVRKGDRNDDAALSQDEFLAALVPSRPEKPIEQKQSTSFPQADAVRYLLVSLDTKADGYIEADEVPERLQRIFDEMLERFDANDNDALERYELSRSFQGLGQIAARYAARERIDPAAELKKLEKTQGKAINRFEEQQRPIIEQFGDPGQARTIFTRLDVNRDKRLDAAEIPEPLQAQLEQFIRRADRDGDGGLSEREFLAGAERVSRFMKRQRPEMMSEEGDMPNRKPRRKKAAAKANS
jgi:Ca2+-binding EF-hand superfamily protein